MSKVVLITGCSTGIGRALVGECAARGHKVIATARRPESLDDLCGENVRALALDVTDTGSIDAAVQDILSNEGRIDTLVNNAGYGQMGPMLDVSLEQLRGQYETNVVGLMAVIKAVAPHMIKKRSGCIANVGSVSGILATPFAGTYCSSKAAVHLISDALRMELAPFGVHVVIIRPGGVQSSIGETAASFLALAENSLYEPVRANIERRAKASQEGATPASETARDIADGIFAAEPPHIIPTGTGAKKFPAYKRWIPGKRLDKMLSQRFGLTKLGGS